MIPIIVLGKCHILTGSNINPFTPLPVDKTIIHALPYRAYPAATILLPGNNTSFSDASPSPS